MTLHIHNSEADRLAHELSARTGKSVDDIVLEALRREEAECADAKPRAPTEEELDAWEKEVMDIARHCASLPVYDNRSPEEILGYDDLGLPT